MIIQSKRVYIGSQFIPAQLEITDNKITHIKPYNQSSVDIDYHNQRIIPGFIDIHTHGGYNYDCNSMDVDGLLNFTQQLLKEGVTSFLPTTVTDTKANLINAIKTINKAYLLNDKGANIIGIHLEGPFINTKNKGAQNKNHIIPPSLEIFKDLQKEANNLVKIITIASELDQDFTLTRYAHNKGVVVSLGHTNATYEETSLAFGNGVTSLTHAYNGMSPPTHRQPNAIGYALANEEMYTEIICDGNHVVWPIIKNLIKTKGPNHVIMISDSLPLKGCPQCIYQLGETTIEIAANGSGYIKGTTTLAGSTIKFNQCIKDLLEKADLPFSWIMNMMSLNPARLLNIDHIKGRIKTGYDADLVVIDDEYNIKATYVLGELRWKIDED